MLEKVPPEIWKKIFQYVTYGDVWNAYKTIGKDCNYLGQFLWKEFVQQETIRRLEIQLSLSDSKHWLYGLHQQVDRDKQPAYPPKGFFYCEKLHCYSKKEEFYIVLFRNLSFEKFSSHGYIDQNGSIYPQLQIKSVRHNGMLFKYL